MASRRFLRLRGTRLAAVAFAAALGTGFDAGPAAAGFFDEIGEMFGFQQQRYRDPFTIRVTPRRAKPRLARRPRPPVKAAVIDPAQNPRWYLQDPTLRRGDIVVSRDGALVYDGRGASRQHEREDFVALKDAKSVPKSVRRLVESLASVPSRQEDSAAASSSDDAAGRAAAIVPPLSP